MDKIKIKNQKSKIKIIRQKKFWILDCHFVFCIFIFAFILLLPQSGTCDILRLKEIPEGKEGSEVEILEERENSFIIEIPKNEIEVIKRKRPTEIELWKEKRILWEDTGDYIAIYLPKEKIVLPEEYTGEEYDSAKALKEELKYTGAESRPPEATFWQATGKVAGRILKNGQPLQGARVKIVNVSFQENLVSRLLGPKQARPEDLVLETTSDELGNFEFSSVPLGEYDIYWSVPGTDSWYRRLSEKPDITVRPGETVQYPDIEIK
jgi:hypothetical protein